jgi:2-polyprenyl-3-methyl-5-hydroxy-6-metoxy-1,4-benzoquinol methylase
MRRNCRRRAATIPSSTWSAATRCCRCIGRFDAVVAVDLVDHVPHPRRLVANALSALRPGGVLVLTSNFHGYSKNLALALAGRFDARWDPLTDDGRLKFFSRSTLVSLLAECGLEDLHFETAGRIPMFARTMLAAGRRLP